MTLVVTQRACIAQDIYLFALERKDGLALPPFTPGAHLLVRTPVGLERRYSLCGPSSLKTRYLIAVKREPGGGGSRSMADDVAEGTRLEVAGPDNYFPLKTDALSHLLIAGGIGITPIISMARHLQDQGASFKLVYCTRTPEMTAFRDELATSDFAARTTIHHDDGVPGRAFDFGKLLAERQDGVHIYCCGPRPLMQAVRHATKHWAHDTVHFEDFAASEAISPGSNRSFRVRLAKSGYLIDIPSDATILDTLRKQGIDAPSSCQSGICGLCRTRLIAGKADHRDFILDEDEQDTNVMICVSRALTEELTLDL